MRSARRPRCERLFPTAGDLSANNVLLQKAAADARGFVAKVADLGLARLLPAGQQQMVTEQLGTLQYMPKEMLQEGRLTPACDVFRRETGAAMDLCRWGLPVPRLCLTAPYPLSASSWIR